MKHIDNWLDEEPISGNEAFAKEFLEHCRRPSYAVDYDWIERNPLYCSYKGECVRCTGASRLGDIWLTYDLNRSSGYDKRVCVTECSDWSSVPFTL